MLNPFRPRPNSCDDLPQGTYDLDRPDQRAVARLVASLAEDEPSLAWRAGLNDRLRADAKRQRGAHVVRLGALASGFAAVCAIGVAFMSASPGVPTIDAPRVAMPERNGDPTAVSGPSSDHSKLAGLDLLAIHGEGSASAELSAAGASGAETDLSDAEIREVVVSQLL